jgi:cysteine-rich repeat protein
MRLLLLALLGCKDDPQTRPDDNTDTPVVEDEDPPPCGDGDLDDGEQCDDGAGNSDDAPDACRTTCLLPTCGDGVVDGGEGCDDGDLWGGDGCDPTCVAEVGPFEVEPNDVPFIATPTGGALSMRGALTDGDVDCFSLEVADNAFLDATLYDGADSCALSATLTAWDTDDDIMATAIGVDGVCAHLDANADSSLRYLDPGSYVVCVEGYAGAPLPSYRLDLLVGDDSCLGGLVPDAEDDHDLDRIADPCDPDDDADTVPDDRDNCPLVANGPGSQGFSTISDGWIKQWMVTGAFTGQPTTTGCRPSDTQLLGADDALVDPRLGDDASGHPWTLTMPSDGVINFLNLYNVSAPRESYAAAWVYSDVTEDIVLWFGADDGARIWWNGAMVRDISSCQGVYVDGFSQPLTIEAGWNRLVFKIRDNGGGWGLRARFKTPAGVVRTDLEISPGGPFFWEDDQTDSDDDGIGDACDPDP